MSKLSKRILAVLMIIAVCFTALGCGGKDSDDETSAQTPADLMAQSVLVRPNKNDDFRYNIYTHYIEISECLSTKSNIVIPDTIQDLPVYRINASAFSGQTTFTTLVMTNNIIEIGDNAFAGCTNLSSVTLSNNLETMGQNAFSGCENLKAITIPGSLTEIPSGAFSGCSRLLSAKIEKSKTSITTNEDGTTNAFRVLSGAFSNCPELRVVWIPNDFSEIANNEFNGSMENLTICGAEESAAAVFAAENLIDFKTEAEFKELSGNALATQTKKIKESALSTTWKMNLFGVYAFGSDFKYDIHIRDKNKKSEYKTINKIETVNPNENVIFISFVMENLSSSVQNVNLLDFEVDVDGYSRRINSYDYVKAISDISQGTMDGSPLNGEVQSVSAKLGCLAVRVPSDWKTISIVYKGDITLESTAFEVNRDDVYIKWCNVATQQSSTPNVPTQAETTTAAQTQPSITEVPTTLPVNVPTTTKAN